MRTSPSCTTTYVACASASSGWRRSATPPGQGRIRRSAPAAASAHSTRGANGMMPAGIASARAGTGRDPEMSDMAAAYRAAAARFAKAPTRTR